MRKQKNAQRARPFALPPGYEVTISEPDAAARTGWGFSVRFVGSFVGPPRPLGLGGNYPTRERAERSARLLALDDQKARAREAARAVAAAFGGLDDLSLLTDEQAAAVRACVEVFDP